MTARGGLGPLACLVVQVAMGLSMESCQAAGRTIVGTWAPDPAACAPVGGMIEIGPKSLTGDELACVFDDVARSGDVVTWHGRCSEGGASRPATVVAIPTGESLHVSMNRTEIGIYRRCSNGSVPAPAPPPADDPWNAERWRADVDTIGGGHAHHATLIGTATRSEQGDSVEVTCTDKDLATGKTMVVRHHAWAMARQGDWEGDAGPLGSFGSRDGKTLRWFGPSACPAGPITWNRR